MSENNIAWLCFKENIEKRSILEKILPDEYKYKVSSFKIIDQSLISSETKFEAAFSVNICTEEGIKKSLTEFQASSSTNYNILHGDTKGGKKVIIAGYRKCHHNIRKRTKSGNNSTDPDALKDPKTQGKQTNCPTSITFKLKTTVEHEHDKNCSLHP